MNGKTGWACLVVVGLTVPAFAAQDPQRDRRDIRQDATDVRRDAQDVKQDKVDIRDDKEDGQKADARTDQADLKKDQRDLRKDRRDLKADRRDGRRDRRHRTPKQASGQTGRPPLHVPDDSRLSAGTDSKTGAEDSTTSAALR